jgi:hypothetical protein
MKYVIARNYIEFRAWCREHGIRYHSYPSDVRYVSGVHSLLGVSEATFEKIGTYEKREDWPEIEEQMRIIEAFNEKQK